MATLNTPEKSYESAAVEEKWNNQYNELYLVDVENMDISLNSTSRIYIRIRDNARIFESPISMCQYVDKY